MSTPNVSTIQTLSERIGLSTTSLESLGISRNGTAWLIPERNADGEVIGTAKRFDNGDKGFVAGGKRGLTMATPLPPYAGTSADDPILIVEGMSDTAAAIDLGFTALGRPSNTGGLEHLRPLVKGRHVVLVGENDGDGADDPKRPGKIGAEKIAQGLLDIVATVRIIYPPASVKDLREWKSGGPAGCDRDEVLAVIRSAEPVQREEADAGPPPLRWVPFPVEALPSILRLYVHEAAKAIACDSSFIALPLLAMLAPCVGTTRAAMLKRSWRELCILWCAVISPSGTRKTPAMSAVLRPLHRLQRKALDAHAEAMKLYEHESAEYERDLADWKRRKSGEPPVKPEPPAATRFLVNDTTVEAQAPLLRANPRGLLMWCDELAAWIGDMDRYAKSKGGDVARWLSAWSGESVVIDRKTSGTIYIPRAAVSVTGTIQPEILRRVLGAQLRENGLAARVLMAMPPQRPAPWNEDDVSNSTEQALADIVQRLHELTHVVDGDGHEQPLDVPFTAEAKAAFIAWHDAHELELAEASGDLAAALAKLRGYCARLALLMQMVRWAANDAPADMIDAESVRSAVVLVEWFKGEAKRIYALLAEDDGGRERRQLVDWITRRGGSVTARDLTHGLRQFRGKADAAEKALAELVRDGAAEWDETTDAKGGRPAVRIRLVTGVTVTNTPSNPVESSGFGDGDSGDTHINPRDENDLGAGCSDIVEDER